MKTDTVKKLNMENRSTWTCNIFNPNDFSVCDCECNMDRWTYAQICTIVIIDYYYNKIWMKSDFITQKS